jgi:hypothetical protein
VDMLKRDRLFSRMAPAPYMCNVRGLLVEEIRGQQEVIARCFQDLEIAMDHEYDPSYRFSFGSLSC